MVKAVSSQLDLSPFLMKTYIFIFLPLDSKLDSFVFIFSNCCMKRSHNFLIYLHLDSLNCHRLA